jgi:hypothetical protein
MSRETSAALAVAGVVHLEKHMGGGDEGGPRGASAGSASVVRPS